MNNKYTDLYDCINSDNFWCVSFCEKSVPTAGSQTLPNYKNIKKGIKTLKIIHHKTGDVTVVTEFGYLKFWKITINRMK